MLLVAWVLQHRSRLTLCLISCTCSSASRCLLLFLGAGLGPVSVDSTDGLVLISTYWLLMRILILDHKRALHTSSIKSSLATHMGPAQHAPDLLLPQHANISLGHKHAVLKAVTK